MNIYCPRLLQYLQRIVAKYDCDVIQRGAELLGWSLDDLADFALVNDAYARAFRAPFPARSCVQIAAIPKGARFEVEAIAMR